MMIRTTGFGAGEGDTAGQSRASVRRPGVALGRLAAQPDREQRHRDGLEHSRDGDERDCGAGDRDDADEQRDSGARAAAPQRARSDDRRPERSRDGPGGARERFGPGEDGDRDRDRGDPADRGCERPAKDDPGGEHPEGDADTGEHADPVPGTHQTSSVLGRGRKQDGAASPRQLDKDVKAGHVRRAWRSGALTPGCALPAHRPSSAAARPPLRAGAPRRSTRSGSRPG